MGSNQSRDCVGDHWHSLDLLRVEKKKSTNCEVIRAGDARLYLTFPNKNASLESVIYYDRPKHPGYRKGNPETQNPNIKKWVIIATTNSSDVRVVPAQSLVTRNYPVTGSRFWVRGNYPPMQVRFLLAALRYCVYSEYTKMQIRLPA